MKDERLKEVPQSNSYIAPRPWRRRKWYWISLLVIIFLVTSDGGIGGALGGRRSRSVCG